MECDKITRFSYYFIGGFFVLLMVLHLSVPLLTILFALGLLHVCRMSGARYFCVFLFVLVVSALFTGFGYFVNRAVNAIPEIVENSLPKIIQLADHYRVTLPFSDVDTLKVVSFDFLKTELSFMTNFAKLASKEFLYLIIGLVIALGIFLNPQMDLRPAGTNNLYTAMCVAIGERFSRLFSSFKSVMGAQILISGINTLLTGAFLMAEGLPNIELLIVVTFICGLLPVIGNILSNAIIFCVAITISVSLGVHALIFLVLLHKGEYFLNSRIIGHKINNPMWLTLACLVLGERLMGIPGMILAPVFLSYIKLEASGIKGQDHGEFS